MSAVDDLVGRDPERERIDSFLAPGGETAPAVLVLEGEAGIGKTTLWRAGVARAQELGYQVLDCTLTASEARLAFTGLADLVTGVFEEVAASLARPQRAALEEALLLRDDARSPPDERAVALGLLGVLRELSSLRPVVVAVDDLQWLDPSSAAMLSFATRRLRDEPVRLLLARRLEEGSDPDPLHLDRSGLPIERIPVGALTLGALHRLLRTRLSRTLTRPRLSHIHAASAGNPLHALELARALEALNPQAPGSLSSLLRARIMALPRPTRQALALTSLAAESTLAVLARAGITRPAERLTPAIDAELVSIDGDRIRLAHPLVAAAALATLDEAERRGAHRKLARAASSSEERARHLGRCADGPDAEIAASLEQAAATAHRRGARLASAELYEEAAILTPTHEAGARGRRLTHAGQAFYEAGDAERGQHLLETAVEGLPEGPERVEARWRLGIVLDETGDWQRATRVWSEALGLTGDPGLVAEIRRSMAYYSLYTGSVEDAVAHGRAALEAAEANGERQLIAYALGACAFASALAGDAACDDYVRRALELDHPSFTGEWSPLAVAAEVGRVTGHMADSLHGYEVVRDRAIEVGDVSVEQWAAFGLAASELLAGDYVRAAELVDTVVEIADQTRVMRIPAAMLRANVHAHQGNLERARRETLDALATARGVGERMHELNLLHVLSFVELSAGNAEASLELSVASRTLAAELGVRHASILRWALYEAETAAALGYLDRAELAMAAYDHWAPEHIPGWIQGIALRARSAQLAGAGDLPAARETLESALGLDLGDVPFEAARTGLALGTLLRRLREHAGARVALEAARDTFARIGAPAWEAHAANELARVPGRRSRDRDELTDAERRIADLVAEGRSNKAVAAELSLSVKTVEVTLTRVYRKLGVRSRTHLAATLHARG